MLASTGIRIVVRNTSMMLPIQNDPNTVHTNSGLVVKSSGPGCSPTMSNPPRSTAVVPDAGIPSAKSGIIAA